MNARNRSDPFVLEALITFDKLPTVVQMLVTAEAWIDRVFPRLEGRLPDDRSMRAYYMVRLVACQARRAGGLVAGVSPPEPLPPGALLALPPTGLPTVLLLETEESTRAPRPAGSRADAAFRAAAFRAAAFRAAAFRAAAWVAIGVCACRAFDCTPLTLRSSTTRLC